MKNIIEKNVQRSVSAERSESGLDIVHISDSSIS